MGPKQPGPIIIPLPTSPQNVLQNLAKAYVERDSIETAAVYDIAYQGTSNDPSSPTPILNFSRADEIRHVSALHNNPNIVSVSLDLGPATSWQRMPPNASDPPGWAVIPIPASVVQLSDVGSNTVYTSTNRTMEFTFKPTVSSPGDTTWTVVRWTEFAN